MTTFSLNDRPEYLTPSEPRGDTERRILSILALATGKARRFLHRLPERARTRYDLEDVLQEIWTELLAKDRHYNPSRSSYVTFAGLLVDRLLQRLGDRLCRGPRREPLGDDLSDARADEPIESIGRAEARQEAAEAVGRALAGLDDRSHFVLTANYGIGREEMTVMQLSAWLVQSPSQIVGARSRAENLVRSALAG